MFQFKNLIKTTFILVVITVYDNFYQLQFFIKDILVPVHSLKECLYSVTDAQP